MTAFICPDDITENHWLSSASSHTEHFSIGCHCCQAGWLTESHTAQSGPSWPHTAEATGIAARMYYTRHSMPAPPSRCHTKSTSLPLSLLPHLLPSSAAAAEARRHIHISHTHRPDRCACPSLSSLPPLAATIHRRTDLFFLFLPSELLSLPLTVISALPPPKAEGGLSRERGEHCISHLCI